MALLQLTPESPAPHREEFESRESLSHFSDSPIAHAALASLLFERRGVRIRDQPKNACVPTRCIAQRFALLPRPATQVYGDHFGIQIERNAVSWFAIDEYDFSGRSPHHMHHLCYLRTERLRICTVCQP